MNSEEKKAFLFEQTCILIAARVSEKGSSPKIAIEQRFEETYKALLAEFNKDYIKNTK